MPKRQEILYKDFSARLQPRTVWLSSELGTAKRIDSNFGPKYVPKSAIKPKSGARKLTEVEDNAIGRALRRRTNRKLRQAGKPHAAR